GCRQLGIPLSAPAIYEQTDALECVERNADGERYMEERFDRAGRGNARDIEDKSRDQATVLKKAQQP
ncbi:hypothetical protein ABTN18_20735, partial [Acinetobacter baumannii]